MSEVPLYIINKSLQEGSIENHALTSSANSGIVVLKAHRLFYHSTLGVIVIKNKKKLTWEGCAWQGLPGGWEEGEKADGKAFFIDHNSATTHWELR